jgi:hypothetical protein
MRFPRVIRLDESDRRVYERPSLPGEWAVSGSFAFVDHDPAALHGKAAQAFRNGFLGTESFGWTTLVAVEEISDDEYAAVLDRLAAHFVTNYGAPDRTAALSAAREEADFAASLCEHPPHTLLAVERRIENGEIVEEFRVVRPSGADHARVRLWGIENEGEVP